MTETITYVMISPEQLSLFGTSSEYRVFGAALNEQNECVSLSSLSWALRERLCSNCTKTCSQGGYIWTREDYQSQGIFNELFSFIKEQSGIDKVYISKTGPFHLLLAEKYGLFVPEDKTLLKDLGPLSDDYAECVRIAGLITEKFQSEGVV